MDYKFREDTLIGVLPFFHIYGGVITLLAGLRHGVKIVTLPKFEPTTFLGTVQDHRVLHFYSNLFQPVYRFVGNK